MRWPVETYKSEVSCIEAKYPWWTWANSRVLFWKTIRERDDGEGTKANKRERKEDGWVRGLLGKRKKNNTDRKCPLIFDEIEQQ